MRPAPSLVFTLTALVAVAGPSPAARACGGFFCDNLDPVVQTAERILFRINDDATTTVIVEIQYAGPPSDFGWVLPVAPGLSVEDLGTAPAGLFDALEERTAPVFEREAITGAGVDDAGPGCGLGRRGGGDDWTPPPPDISGVEVVGEAVVGPYAIEIITAEEGANLSNWLLLNGYQIAPSAAPAMDHYIDLGMAFVGVKLKADVPAGPIDALSFTVPGTTPSIPLILTSVAAAAEMEVLAYVAAPGRHVPGNYADVDFDYQSVEWVDAETTDYLERVPPAIDEAGGKGWITEFAGRLGERVVIEGSVIDEVLDRDDYLTRFRTFLSPWEMDVDPYWMPSAEAGDVDNHHVLHEDYAAVIPSPRPLAGMAGAALMLLPGLALARRRRRAPT